MRGAPSHTHSLRANAIQRGQVIGKAVSFSETAQAQQEQCDQRHERKRLQFPSGSMGLGRKLLRALILRRRFSGY